MDKDRIIRLRIEIIGITRKKYYNIINLKIKVDKKYLSKSVNMWYYRGKIRIKPDWNVKLNMRVRNMSLCILD